MYEKRTKLEYAKAPITLNYEKSANLLAVQYDCREKESIEIISYRYTSSENIPYFEPVAPLGNMSRKARAITNSRGWWIINH